MTRVGIHGGLNEIGGNKILVDSGRSSVMLDFGKAFGAEDRFFDFPLYVPRTRLDLVRTGILPEIRGLYQHENLEVEYGDKEPRGVVETPDPGPPVDGILLSHGHQDHCGYLGLVRRDIPVVTGEVTRRFMELREEQQNGGFTHVGAFDHFEPIGAGDAHVVGDIEATYHPVDHSILGAGAFILEAGEARIGFTGDLRFHGYRAGETEAFLDALAAEHVDVLLCEGTRVTGEEPEARCSFCGQPVPGGEATERNALHSEEAVFERASKIARETEGLVVYDGSPADLDRVRTLHRVAEATGRKLLVGLRHAHFLVNLDAHVPGLPPVEDLGIYFPRAKLRSNLNRYEEVVGEHDGAYVETFTGSRYGYPRDLVEHERIDEGTIFWGPHGRERIVEDGDAYILYTTSGIQAMMQFKPPEGKIEGTYVYGKAEPFNEEMEITFEKLENWVELCGLDWGWAHTSGHAPNEGIRRVVDAADPDLLVPIHTETADVMADWVGEDRARVWPRETRTPVSFEIP